MIISLVDHPELEWQGRIAYLLARNEEKHVDLYAMDLIWAVASRYLQGARRPSEIWWGEKQDKRTAKQIIKDTINGLGGG